MNYIVSFDVGLVDSNNYRAGDVCLDKTEDFDELKRIASGTTPRNQFMYCISMASSEPKLQEAFELLEKATGRRPLADLWYASTHKQTYYPVQIKRVPNEDELNQSRWLLLLPGDIIMTGHCEVSPDGTYLIPGVIRTKKISYGTNSPGWWTQLFTTPLKDLLLQNGLNIDFRPARLKKGGDSVLWQLQTKVEMPLLAMTLLNSRYQPFEGDHTKEGCLVRDGYYYPLVLRYHKQDIAKMVSFDVAFTREKVGGSHQLHPRIIVSQRFRQVADKLAPGQFRYSPVVVSEGDDLKTRYTVPELAPPE